MPHPVRLTVRLPIGSLGEQQFRLISYSTDTVLHLFVCSSSIAYKTTYIHLAKRSRGGARVPSRSVFSVSFFFLFF